MGTTTSGAWSAITSVVLSLVLLVLAALAGLAFAISWAARLFMNLLRGEERMYDAYFETISANLVLALPPGPATGFTLARRRAELNDLRRDAYSSWQAHMGRSQRFSLAPLFALEAEIVVAMPDDMITTRFWSIEERFRRVVSPAMQQAWTERWAKAYSRDFSASQMRDEACTLLSRIYSTYLCTIGREQAVRALKLFILVVVVASAGLASLIAHKTLPFFEPSAGQNIPQRTGFVLLFSVGMFGAAVSVIRRLSSAIDGNVMKGDAMMELAGLNFGHAGIAISLLLGGVFAIVLYFILLGGTSAIEALGSAGTALFPAFITPAAGLSLSCHPSGPVLQACGLDAISRGLGLQDLNSLARMLVLAFLSGFSERLVPDALDRIAGQLDQAKKK